MLQVNCCSYHKAKALLGLSAKVTIIKSKLALGVVSGSRGPMTASWLNSWLLCGFLWRDLEHTTEGFSLRTQFRPQTLKCTQREEVCFDQLPNAKCYQGHVSKHTKHMHITVLHYVFRKGMLSHGWQMRKADSAE